MCTARHVSGIVLALSLSLFAASCIGPSNEADENEPNMLRTTLGRWRVVERDSLFHHTNTTMGRARLAVKDDSLHFEAYEDYPGPMAYTTHVIVPVSEVENGPYGWAWVDDRTVSGLEVFCRLQATVTDVDTIQVCYQEVYEDPTLDDIADQPDMYYWCFWMVRE